MTSRGIHIILIFSLMALSFLIGVVTGKGKGIPFVGKEKTNWAIGIYKGGSPFDLSQENINNPVLTHEDITDRTANFVADPFMVQVDNAWYLFSR